MKINQEKVEKAIEVINALTMPEKGFPNALKGDISSFGASIIQAGLLPSVLFFSEGELKADYNWAETKDRRAQLMNVIFKVAFDEIPTVAKRPLFGKVRAANNAANNAETLDQITEAALAVKVAMRAFKFDKT